jgi:hypothetical protein
LSFSLEVAFSAVVGVEFGPGESGALRLARTIFEALIVGAPLNDFGIERSIASGFR